MKISPKYISYCIFLLLSLASCAQVDNAKQEMINHIYNMYTTPKEGNYNTPQQNKENWAKSGDASHIMDLRKTFGTINIMITSPKKEFWINEGVKLINNITESSKESKNILGNKTYKDNYRGWISLNKKRSYHKEVPLYESYSFSYITEFLYILKEQGWTEKSAKNKEWWDNTLSFIEHNVWEKWYVRGEKSSKKNPYWNLLRGAVQPGSLWAFTALYLNKITTSDEIKEQTALVVSQFDKLLKRNLFIRNDAYLWKSSYVNVKDTYGYKSSIEDIQDVSHGNHIITYIVASYEIGNENWTIDDIDKFSNTLKIFIYNKKRGYFHDNIDGTDAMGNGANSGNNIADGWLKLAAYNKDIMEIFKLFQNSDHSKKYHQEIQFEANLYNALNKMEASK